MHISHEPTGGWTYPLQLIPIYRDYVWGGQRLRPGQRTAEAWVIFEENRIASGPWAGSTLAQVAAEYPAGLLGERAVALTGARFPLLIKLLDSVQWLSVQLHPDDTLAAALEGPGYFGKTEAWHVLDAAPDSQIIAGLRPEITAETLANAIRDGSIADWVTYRHVQAGDTIFMPARTIHAVGPGLLMYEVQQSSDLTYRVFDWNRPPTPNRPLHIAQSLAVADPTAIPSVRPATAVAEGEAAILAACPYFTLELLASQTQPITLDTAGQTFHALTAIKGTAAIIPFSEQNEAHSIMLGQYDSVVVPAACGSYEIRPLSDCRILKASTAP